MIIKIDNDRYVNTDRIASILPDPSRPDRYIVYLDCPIERALEISGAVLDYIMDSIDANISFASEAVLTEVAATRSLSSRTASLLQNHVNGLTFTEISSLLGQDPVVDENDLGEALETLVKENVITAKRDGAPGFEWHWYHNANSTRKTEW